MKRKRKILITGGAGFIGSSLAERLIRDKENYVIIIDNLSTGHIDKIIRPVSDNWHFIKCDVNNYKEIAEVMFSYRFDYVFHYAAVVGVQRTLANPILVLKDLDGIRNIIDLSKNTGVKRIYYSSSSEVYGEPVEYPQNEDTTPLNSRLPYAIVKTAGGAFLRSYHQEYDLEYTIFRFFNTYGPKQNKDFVVSRFIINCLLNRNITIYGDGLQTRTFCYIDDNVEACSNAFCNDRFINDVVNIGSDVEITILDLAKIIIKITGAKSEIVHTDPLKEGDMRRRVPDISKMKTLINRPLITIEDGLLKILKEGLFELRC
ncbi:MAG: NAD-dependent epimerase/dehydratase family protein [Bacteroidia bacterium]|nr:NAD-dependent epimerase/dehydratase family protein [Bacteroidia bacterium]